MYFGTLYYVGMNRENPLTLNEFLILLETIHNQGISDVRSLLRAGNAVRCLRIQNPNLKKMFIFLRAFIGRLHEAAEVHPRVLVVIRQWEVEAQLLLFRASSPMYCKNVPTNHFPVLLEMVQNQGIWAQCNTSPNSSFVI